jgi:imidazolonepropionase
MPFVIALAVRKLGLSVPEAIAATTATAADLLGFSDRGRLAPGMRADVILLRHLDERMLGYELGGNPVDLVICNGAQVSVR